jgi:hypothetical protein
VAAVAVGSGLWLLAGLTETGGRLHRGAWWPVGVRPLLVGATVGFVVLLAARAAGPRGSARRPTRWWAAGLVVVVVLAGVVLLGVGQAGWAAPAVPPPPPAPAPVPTQDLGQVITNMRNWVMGFLAAYATLSFTIGAVRYMGANGDPAEVDAAKRAFRNAAIGYGLAVLAPVILIALRSVVGG